jgi:hypothetical protein
VLMIVPLWHATKWLTNMTHAMRSSMHLIIILKLCVIKRVCSGFVILEQASIYLSFLLDFHHDCIDFGVVLLQSKVGNSGKTQTGYQKGIVGGTVYHINHNKRPPKPSKIRGPLSVALSLVPCVFTLESCLFVLNMSGICLEFL